jgi:hypothetical protein
MGRVKPKQEKYYEWLNNYLYQFVYLSESDHIIKLMIVQVNFLS